MSMSCGLKIRHSNGGWLFRVVPKWDTVAGHVYSDRGCSLNFWEEADSWAWSRFSPGEGLVCEPAVASMPILSSCGMSALGTMELGHALQHPLEKAILLTIPGKLSSALHGFLLQPGSLWGLTTLSVSQLPLLYSFWFILEAVSQLLRHP